MEYISDSIRSKVALEIPSSFDSLKKKYRFGKSNQIGKKSSFGRVYIIDRERVGKVLNFDGFEEIREEYFAQKISNELGFPVLKAHELVLAYNEDLKTREPMLVMEYGGKRRLLDEEITNEMYMKFLEASSKVKKYLDIGSWEIAHRNAFWDDLEKKVSLFDCGSWCF